VFQYGVLARLIEETHNIGILFISHINRRLYALLRSWHRLEELMNRSPMKTPAHIHACFLPADYHLHVREAIAPFHHDFLPRDEDFLRLLKSLLELC